jgi:hypothetical protein
VFTFATNKKERPDCSIYPQARTGLSKYLWICHGVAPDAPRWPTWRHDGPLGVLVASSCPYGPWANVGVSQRGGKEALLSRAGGLG